MATLEQEVKAFCGAHRLVLKHELGQNYLIDETVLEKIVEAAEVKPDEQVVEIGPGIGVLTRALLKEGARVTAIEIDPRTIPLLHRFAGVADTQKMLTVIEGNALRTPMPDTPYKIVANIPYHITSPLLRHVFLSSALPPASLTLLIQREVAEKICDTKNAGLLTILVGLFGAPRIVTHVPPSSFLPPPKVDSSVLHIASHGQPRAERAIIDRIFTLTKVAFGKKRKMLTNSLGALSDGTAKMREANIDPTRRPQTLSIEEWITLARAWNG